MGGVLGSANGDNVGLYMDDKTSFPPNAGFQYERKKRVMVATPAELESARIPKTNRDYCAHLLLGYHKCRYEVWPMVYKCAHEKHDYLNCEHRDYVLRMKEFERERRLRLREKQLTGAA